jgi:hypothetical protein
MHHAQVESSAAMAGIELEPTRQPESFMKPPEVVLQKLNSKTVLIVAD